MLIWVQLVMGAFMWRACKNTLPTKNRLMAWAVGSGDCCALCGQSETSGHILWGCQYAKAVWSGTKIKLPWLQDPLNDFIDIVWETMNSHPQVDWTMFAMTAWSLWDNRNSVIHEGNVKVMGFWSGLRLIMLTKLNRRNNLNCGSPLRPHVLGLLLDRTGIRLTQMVWFSGTLGAVEVEW